MLDLYKRAIEQIQKQIDEWNDNSPGNGDDFMDEIENIIIDHNDMIYQAKEIKLVEEDK